MRLDELKQRLGDGVDIDWRSFLLRLEPKTSERDAFVAYTQSWLRPAELEPRARFQVWASDAPAPSSSLPAQVAAKTMELVRPELVASFHWALLTAYFSNNRDISDWDVLADIAHQVGADRSAFAADLQTHETAMVQAVIDDHNEAVEQGISAVPTVLIENLVPIPGAQDVETYEAWVTRILSRRSGSG